MVQSRFGRNPRDIEVLLGCIGFRVAKSRGTLLQVPIKRTTVIWVHMFISGPPYLGRLPHSWRALGTFIVGWGGVLLPTEKTTHGL